MRSNKILKVKNAVERMKLDESKFYQLVWFARNCNKEKHLKDENYEAMGTLKYIETMYPEEVAKLSEKDNWNHGFNSGMLAASRLYLEMIQGNPQFALELYPHLDS